MDPPPVQYVTTSDGYSIAYAVSGQGLPLVFMPGSFDHVQLAWRYPGLDTWLPALAARFQLVQFDPRGSGMSTRELPEDISMLDYLRDIEAVVDKLQIERFILFGGGRPMYRAIKYAVDHPDAVLALIMTGGLSLSAWRAPVQWVGLPDQDWELFLYSVVPRDRSPEDARLTVDLLKQSYDQRNFVLRMHAEATGYETAEVLAELKTPALVIHARDYALVDVAQAMKLAQLCGARMALIDGNTIFGNTEQGISAIEAFLREVLPTAPMASLGELSSRELEVLRLIVAGRSNQQIADELVISLNTVRRHVSNIFVKTGAASRAAAAIYARDHSLA